MKWQRATFALAALACADPGPKLPNIVLWDCEPAFFQPFQGQKMTARCQLGWDAPPTVHEPVTWSSSAPGVASVTGEGVLVSVTANAPGTATLTAKVRDKVSSFDVTVLASGGPRITASVRVENGAPFRVGQTICARYLFDIQAFDSDGARRPLQQEADVQSPANSTVVTSEPTSTGCGFEAPAPGVLIRAVAAGTAVFTVTYAGLSTTAVLTVSP